MLTYAIIALIVLAIWSYIASLQNRITKLTASRQSWIDAYYVLLSDYDGTESDYHTAMRLYDHAITSEKIRAGHIPSTKIAYTVGTNGKQHTESIVALDMFNMPVGDYAPKFDNDGAITYAPIAKIEVVKSEPKSSNGNGKNAPKSDNGEPKTFEPVKVKDQSHNLSAIESILGNKLSDKERESAIKQLGKDRTVEGIAQSTKTWRESDAKKSKK